MRRLCFLSIFDLTIVQFEVASRLRKQGYDIVWITTNPAWSQWLRNKGVADDHLLELSYTADELAVVSADEQLRSEIARAELATLRNVNGAMLADQFVMEKQRPDTNAIMSAYYRDVKAFLRRHRTDIVFAEPTNSSDLVTCLVCQELGIKYYFPQSLRYPDRRFFFGEGVVPSRLVPLAPDKSNDVDGQQLIDEFCARKARPSYFVANNNQAVVSTDMASRVARNRLGRVTSGDRIWMTHHDTAERVRYTIRRLVNGFVLKRVMRYPQLSDISGRIAFFGLHVQPENSIDVQGPYFSDQLKLIKDIRRSLPFDTTLVVKEHPNRLGSRPLSFFKFLRSIPNVVLVSHDVSTFDIYERADMVFTVAGTTAYEAGMLGVPAVVFSPIYFDQLSTVLCCRNAADLPALIRQIRQGLRQDRQHDASVLASFVHDSASGYWTDPLTDPTVLEPANLDALCSGFLRVIEHAVVPEYV